MGDVGVGNANARRGARTGAASPGRLRGTPSDFCSAPPPRFARHLPRPAAHSWRGFARCAVEDDRRSTAPSTTLSGAVCASCAEHLPSFAGEVSSERSERNGGAVRPRTAGEAVLKRCPCSSLLRSPSDAFSAPPPRFARHLPRPAAQSRGGVRLSRDRATIDVGHSKALCATAPPACCAFLGRVCSLRGRRRSTIDSAVSGWGGCGSAWLRPSCSGSSHRTTARVKVGG